ncbi:hypothetical protein RvY_14816-1 [Ramazzottius varieornatus]|uniref:Uncharacterized protein n=1 Tax=Ramazzottius varieornatus TaxID=947166 RepID=A0A1D1W0Z3_RAMVA|nr:hypothetical protein RvY_14816-1 [Ramazzottius varieornatus]
MERSRKSRLCERRGSPQMEKLSPEYRTSPLAGRAPCREESIHIGDRASHRKQRCQRRSGKNVPAAQGRTALYRRGNVECKKKLGSSLKFTVFFGCAHTANQRYCGCGCVCYRSATQGRVEVRRTVGLDGPGARAFG